MERLQAFNAGSVTRSTTASCRLVRYRAKSNEKRSQSLRPFELAPPQDSRVVVDVELWPTTRMKRGGNGDNRKLKLNLLRKRPKGRSCSGPGPLILSAASRPTGLLPVNIRGTTHAISARTFCDGQIKNQDRSQRSFAHQTLNAAVWRWPKNTPRENHCQVGNLKH